MGETAVVEDLLDAIRSRHGARIASCFSPGAKLRALTPHRLREEDGPEAIAAQYAFWLDSLESYDVVAGDVTRSQTVSGCATAFGGATR